MIDAAYARTMARYNRWQNQSLYGAADGLSDAARKEDGTAFFNSIHDTLWHILWADDLWHRRFTDQPRGPERFRDPESPLRDWTALRAARIAMDETLVSWADALDPDWLAGDLTWTSGFTGQTRTMPRSLCVTHFFNHQTHHRGQAHALLTRFGAKPEDTDLILLPPD